MCLQCCTSITCTPHTDVLATLVAIPTAPQHDTVFLAAARAAQPLVAHLGAGSWPRIRPLVHASAAHPLVAVREAVAQSLPALAEYEHNCGAPCILLCTQSLFFCACRHTLNAFISMFMHAGNWCMYPNYINNYIQENGHVCVCVSSAHVSCGRAVVCANAPVTLPPPGCWVLRLQRQSSCLWWARTGRTKRLTSDWPWQGGPGAW